MLTKKIEDALLKVNVSFAQQLKAERIRQGYDMKSLGTLIGVDTTRIRVIESGKTYPQLNTILKMVMALKLRLVIDATGEKGKIVNLYLEKI